MSSLLAANMKDVKEVVNDLFDLLFSRESREGSSDVDGWGLLGEPKLRALGVLRLRPPTRAASGSSSSLGVGSSSLGDIKRQT